MKKGHRRDVTIRSNDSLHSYRTSVFAMSTKNTSQSGQSLINMNSIRKPFKKTNDKKLNGNRVMLKLSQPE
jgi:hypothetical protein